ncbi:hypothetical protein AXFE_28630 [Acidithrix ferrooxidans]|uniref:Uncharacterized protein n=1 Tax=Acidithrix ferrooxidans TaxID=1280514 RepID=A0A0D8HEI1_9ACTN|nr:hypothetical protein AXFE_28630 [Acidithrix ferrooxidans]
MTQGMTFDKGVDFDFNSNNALRAPLLLKAAPSKKSISQKELPQKNPNYKLAIPSRNLAVTTLLLQENPLQSIKIRPFIGEISKTIAYPKRI